MADYNVNMKQWNGTSFDNVLPLAYNAKQLEGKTYNEIYNTLKQYVDGNFGNCQMEHGSYVGTGTVGENVPTVITFSIKPIVVIVCATISNDIASVVVRDTHRTMSTTRAGNSVVAWTDNSVSFAYNGSSGYSQNNGQGETYYYVALGLSSS